MTKSMSSKADAINLSAKFSSAMAWRKTKPRKKLISGRKGSSQPLPPRDAHAMRPGIPLCWVSRLHHRGCPKIGGKIFVERRTHGHHFTDHSYPLACWRASDLAI